MDSVANYAKEHPEAPIGHITGMSLSLGLLSCIEIETFKGCFAILAEGTPTEGATLDMKVEPLPCTCNDCGASFELTKRHFVCPQCGARSLLFTGGHGLTLTSLEVGKKD